MHQHHEITNLGPLDDEESLLRSLRLKAMRPEGRFRWVAARGNIIIWERGTGHGSPNFWIAKMRKFDAHRSNKRAPGGI